MCNVTMALATLNWLQFESCSITVFWFFPGHLVETDTLENVFMIGINRPEKRNCVNTETADQLWKAFEEFESNDDLFVAVLHGKGQTFHFLDLLDP